MSMRYYVKRGFEDDLIENLDKYRSCGILGLAGMGKTTTARYIYVKLKRKGVNVVYLTSDNESKTIEFNLSKDDKEVVRCISLRQVWSKTGDEVTALAHAVVRAIKGSTVSGLSEKARRALEWIVEKFSGKKIEKIEHLERIKLRVSVGGEEIKEVVDKFYKWFEGVFGEEIVKKLGSVKEVKHLIESFFDRVRGIETSTLELLFESVAFVMAGLIPVSIARSVAHLLKTEPEIKENVVFIVDDIADLNESELTNLVKFLGVVMENDGRVLFVKRLNDASTEGLNDYMDILKFFSMESGIDLDRVLFRGAKDYFDVDLRKRLFLMDSAEKEEFRSILEANGYKVEDEDLDVIYNASAGTICIALYMLEMGFSVEDMKKIAKPEMYYTWSKISKCENEEERRKMIESNKALRFRSIFKIYCRLREKNPCYVALLVNHVAEEELERFCSDDRILDRFGSCKVVSFSDEYYWILESCEEYYLGKRRKVYRIRDDWRKFSYFVHALCDHHVHGKEVEEDLKVVRDVLTDIFDDELEKSGQFTYRMLWFGLENIEWLFERGILKPKSAFIWGRLALSYLPRKGIESLRVVFKTWIERFNEIVGDRDKLIHALCFARDLAEFGRFLLKEESYYEIAKSLKGFLDKIEGDEAVLCWKTWAYSSLATGLCYKGYIDYCNKCLSKAEETLNRLNKLRYLAEVGYLTRKAKISKIRKEEDAIQILERCLDILKVLKFEDYIAEFFKPLGGDAEEMFEELLKDWKKDISYDLGYVYFGINLDEARRYFEESLKYTRFRKLNSLSLIGRIEVLKNYRFEFEVDGERYNFEKLWKMLEDKIYMFSNEEVAHVCAEHLISSILIRRFDEKLLGYLDCDRAVKTLFYGLSWILGYKLKDFNDLIEILRDFDLMRFPHFDDVRKQVHIDEVKIEVKEMYNCILENKKKEYETYKRLVWNKVYYSDQLLTRIIFFYVTGDLETAKGLSESTSAQFPKIPSELFKELANAIDEEMKAKSDYEKEKAQEKVKKSFVKLFYYMV